MGEMADYITEQGMDQLALHDAGLCEAECQECWYDDLTWTTSDGRELLIVDMATSHLFNVLRMVWNHYCDPRYQLKPFKKWRLSFTKRYIEPRLTFMLITLNRRGDVTDQMRRDLQHMHDHCSGPIINYLEEMS